MDDLRFLTPENLDQIQMDFGTPTFVYDETILRENAKSVMKFPNAFGLFPRYAMKAAPSATILRIFNEEGLGIDASSIFEVERAVRAGMGTESISLSTQEFADEFGNRRPALTSSVIDDVELHFFDVYSTNSFQQLMQG